jgi:hypothetical protein
MIVWREKLVATAIHFGATLVLAAIAAALIFLVWYPPPFQKMVGGTELFMLVVGCDLALGPLMSLVIYNSRKPRRELLTDYTIVGLIQISALVYGVLVVADTRPAYVAFSGDRFEIVGAAELRRKELADARDPKYRTVSWTGPRYVAVVISAADHENALFEALAGNLEHVRPRFYVSYESQLENIRNHAKKVADLAKRKPESRGLLEEAARDTGIADEHLGWLPVAHIKGFWTVLIDTRTSRPVAWIPVDPY